HRRLELGDRITRAFGVRVVAAEHEQVVAALLDELPEQQRTALRLTKLAEQSTRDAAATSGMSETSIRVNAHRGLKRLIAFVRRSETP
ncbi:MAG: sigma factor-like helix-turn-helix DNA-binding protein, partial [Terricaulis sp.]